MYIFIVIAAVFPRIFLEKGFKIRFELIERYHLKLFLCNSLPNLYADILHRKVKVLYTYTLGTRETETLFFN
jgi:hypothetical protein